MAATVMVVEDEPNIGSLVRTYLERDGFRVVWARSGEAARTEHGRQAIDLVVLDLGLPDADGLELCRDLGRELPVVILTARGDEADRLAGFAAGADDYLPKPFSPRELVARARAVLRRGERVASPPLLELGPVALSPDRREVRVDGREVELTGKEFDLLQDLIEHAGAVVSREGLLERVWGFAYAGETRTVDVHVAQLRRKLGHPELIRTVRGIGYKAVAG